MARDDSGFDYVGGVRMGRAMTAAEVREVFALLSERVILDSTPLPKKTKTKLDQKGKPKLGGQNDDS